MSVLLIIISVLGALLLLNFLLLKFSCNKVSNENPKEEKRRYSMADK